MEALLCEILFLSQKQFISLIFYLLVKATIWELIDAKCSKGLHVKYHEQGRGVYNTQRH